MKKGDIIEGIIERVDFPAKGVLITAEGEKCTVKNAVPGRRLKVRVTKLRHGNAEGNIMEVLEKGKEETLYDSTCGHDGCGGCIYNTLDYDRQCSLKGEQVQRLLAESYQEPLHFEGVLKSPSPFEYRNKMEFSFGDAVKDGPLTLGLHKRCSTYDVLSVPDCKIVDADFRMVLKETLTFYSKLDIPYYRRMQHTGFLRHLMVRKSAFTGEMLVCLVTASGGLAYEELKEYLRIEEYKSLITTLTFKGTLKGLLHIVNDSLADIVQSDRTEILYGTDVIEEKLLGLSFNITPFSFFQTNSRGAEVLYSKVREYIGDTSGQIVFDLYSGTGTIAQLAAAVAKKVVGVEIVEEAVAAAKENAKKNGLTNCTFLAGDVLKVLDDISEKPDMIILDPPRDGIHPKALSKIIDYGVKRIVYISCKPTSLARDLVPLHAAGYRILRSVCVDMFPHTANVESCVLLERVSNRKADSYVKLNVKMEDYYRIKAAEGGEVDG